MSAIAAANSTISAAVSHGSVGVSFSGAGFLIFYYIGILEVLTKLGVLNSKSKLAGASSGSLITASFCSGLDPPQIISAGHALAKACRADNSCSGSLDQKLRSILQSHLPDNAWQRCKGKGYISISAGSPIGINRPLLISDFHSQADFIAAAAVSSFIPLWSASRLTKMFRGFEAFDGGYTMQQPCPPDVTYCIRVSSRNPAWPPSRGIDSIFSVLGKLGDTTSGRDISSSTEPRTYPPIESSGLDGQPDPVMLQLAAENNIDIAPGVFSKMPFSQAEWSNWALSPADDGTLRHMYKLGKNDAEMWVKHVGLKKPAVKLVQAEQQRVAKTQQAITKVVQQKQAVHAAASWVGKGAGATIEIPVQTMAAAKQSQKASNL